MFALLLIVKEGCVEYDVLFLFLQCPRIYLNKDFTGYQIHKLMWGGGCPQTPFDSDVLRDKIKSEPQV